VKDRHTIFLASMGPVRIPQKCVRTPYVEFVFLHPVVSTGHIVHSSASGARDIDALFFMLRWDWCSFYKKHAGTSYVEFVCFGSGGIYG
jgi:hypothetical protein